MKIKNTAMVMALMAAGITQAAVSPEEAKQLGNTHTPWGAIKAGNKEGTIPPYEGGLPTSTAPAGFAKDSGHWVDPFASEKPLYAITAKNMGQYADKLSITTQEMLKRYPASYRIDVYPTHRTANYPQSYIDNSLKNATRCKTISAELELENCFGGMPFPIPKTGNEVMWNIEMQYSKPLHGNYEILYVDGAGSAVVAAQQDGYFDYPYFDRRLTVESFNAKAGAFTRIRAVQLYPPRIAGDGTMVAYTAAPIRLPNKGWNYQQGNRRVRSIPDAQYDFPVLTSGGAMFFDEGRLYSGKMDRFDFKLLGTREMIIPYNNYRYNDSTKEQLVAAGGGHHPNPDFMRWELHRVNVVEATLKAGSRHAYAKRRFYVDEDFSGSGMADAWDHADKPYKGYFALNSWAYDKQSPIFSGTAVVYDLSSGVWFSPGVFRSTLGPLRGIIILDDSPPDTEFTPEAMSRASSR